MIATLSWTPEQIEAASRQLEGKSPQDVSQWSVATFGSRLTMATAFGAEGCCLIHMLAEIDPGLRIFNLETGYQFPETLELRELRSEEHTSELQSHLNLVSR